MSKLRLVFFGGPNLKAVYQELIPHIAKTKRIPVEFVDKHWSIGRGMLTRGEAQVAHMCGAKYALHERELKLVAAMTPTLRISKEKAMEFMPFLLPRFGKAKTIDFYGGAVYHSFVVVHKDSPFRHKKRKADMLAQFNGKVCAYNEEASWSGHHAFLRWIKDCGADRGPFRKAIKSGAHRASLKMLLDKEIDVAVIDSTVLTYLYPGLLSEDSELRLIDTTGPVGFPPLAYDWLHVEEQGLTQELEKLRAALLDLRKDKSPLVRETLEKAGITGFARVTRQHYDSIKLSMHRSRDVHYTRKGAPVHHKDKRFKKRFMR